MLAVFFLCLIGFSSALEDCRVPVGMEDGRVGPDQLRASSSHESNSVGANFGRLNMENGGGAWCPKNLVGTTKSEWLEIDLGKDYQITGILTQGRFANGLGREFARHFEIQYWTKGMEGFADYKDSDGSSVLDGNSNTFSVVERRLNPPLVATRVRVLPYSHQVRTTCMRLELLGCPVSYPSASNQSSPGVPEYAGLAVGCLITISSLLLVVLLHQMYRNSHPKQKAGSSNVSVAASFLEQQRARGQDREPVYQVLHDGQLDCSASVAGSIYTVPTTRLSSGVKQQQHFKVPIDLSHQCPVYSTAVDAQPCRPELQLYSQVMMPDLVSLSVSDSEADLTPRLPPLPNEIFFSSLLEPPKYANVHVPQSVL